MEEIEDQSVPIVLYCDSNAAIGSAKRLGVGRIRHLELRELWIQEQIAQKRLQLEKIPGSNNEADILTKQLKGQQLFEMLCESLGEQMDKSAAEEVQWCEATATQQDLWRWKLERTMIRYGNETDFVKKVVKQMVSEDEADVVLSQLMVVMTYS